MGIALGVWKFLTSPIGKFLLIALALAGAIWWIRWDAVREVNKEWEAKWQTRDIADNLAEEKASVAREEAEKGQAALITDLKGLLAAEQAKPPVVVKSTVVKEVIRDVEKVVNAACTTIPAGFVWLRDLSFHPEYATLARTATPEEAARDTGLKAADVAAADGEAIGQLRQFKQDCEFNLAQWDRWYDGQKAVYERWREEVERIRQERKDQAHVGTGMEGGTVARAGGGDRPDLLRGEAPGQGAASAGGSGADGGGGRGEGEESVGALSSVAQVQEKLTP